MKTTPLLEGNHLGYSTPDGRCLFENLNFELSKGSLLLITGPNGAGKSTLLKILLKEITPDQGLVRCTVSPQKIGLLPQMQNLALHLPMQLRDVVRVITNSSVERALNFQLLKPEDLGKAWNTASGGERQRTLLSCLLANEPEILFLDEPFNHLDPESQSVMLEALNHYLKSGRARGVVLVSHREMALPQEINIVKVELKDKS